MAFHCRVRSTVGIQDSDLRRSNSVPVISVYHLNEHSVSVTHVQHVHKRSAK
jgi:hypothetical protein